MDLEVGYEGQKKGEDEASHTENQALQLSSFSRHKLDILSSKIVTTDTSFTHIYLVYFYHEFHESHEYGIGVVDSELVTMIEVFLHSKK